MHIIDISIIVGSLVLVLIAGCSLVKRAAQNIDSYFLGGNTLPWYMLGISNASSMFDISGTMWMVTLLFVYGLKSVWIPWLWPVFNQIFMMVYLAVWLRRSNVLTGAEWIKTRFGNRLGVELSHISVVFFAVVSMVGFMAYAFQGIGKFSAVFLTGALPWELTPHHYALIIMGITGFYVVAGGMYSVVVTDVIQFVIMAAVSVAIAVIAMNRTTAGDIAAAVPEGWSNIFFGWNLDIDWSDKFSLVNDKIASDGYSLFTIFFMMMLFKGVLASSAGPAPNYDMQRVLATKTPKEASLMSWFVNVALLFPRYLMIAGITILGLVFLVPQMKAGGGSIDLERMLPDVINNFMPVGMKGLMIAGLLAAFMSTVSSTVNSGAAYVSNDIYKRYINRNASQKKYVRISYVSSVLLIIVGIAFGFTIDSIHVILSWIVSGLYGGYIAPNVLKWHWWRFNGIGYFTGMVSGIVACIISYITQDYWQHLLPDNNPLYAFPVLLVISTLGSVLGSLLSRPEDEEVLKSFYRTVRPWGFWGPIRKAVLAEKEFIDDINCKRDLFNVVVGIIWQTSITTCPIFLVIRSYRSLACSLAIVAVTSIILKFNWYDKIDGTEEGMRHEG